MKGKEEWEEEQQKKIWMSLYCAKKGGELFLVIFPLLQAQPLHRRGDSSWLEAARGLPWAAAVGENWQYPRGQKGFLSGNLPDFQIRIWCKAHFFLPLCCLQCYPHSTLRLALTKCFSQLILQSCPPVIILQYHSCNSFFISISRSPFFYSKGSEWDTGSSQTAAFHWLNKSLAKWSQAQVW